MEQRGNLGVYVLNRLLFSLVGLQDLEKLLVYLWFILEAILQDELVIATNMVGLHVAVNLP